MVVGMGVVCPACDTVNDLVLELTGVGEPYHFMDGSFVFAEYEATPEAAAARCDGCDVRLMYFDCVELEAMEQCGLLHERVVADRKKLASKARRAPTGALLDVPAEVIARVPRELARDWQVVPFFAELPDLEDDELAVAFNAFHLSKYEERRLGGQLDCNVRGYAASERELVEALVRYYGFRRDEL
jgi:hypothetical protein